MAVDEGLAEDYVFKVWLGRSTFYVPNSKAQKREPLLILSSVDWKVPTGSSISYKVGA
jgi:hypothetical protein